jgi:hypothetical protein
MCVLGVNSVSSVPTACALRRCGEKPTAVVAPRRGALGRRDFLRPEFIAMLNDAGGPRWSYESRAGLLTFVWKKKRRCVCISASHEMLVRSDPRVERK